MITSFAAEAVSTVAVALASVLARLIKRLPDGFHIVEIDFKPTGWRELIVVASA